MYNVYYTLFYYLFLICITLFVFTHQLELNYLLSFLALVFVICINVF